MSRLNSFGIRLVFVIACGLATSTFGSESTLTFIQLNLPQLSGMSGWTFGSQLGGSIGVVTDNALTLGGSPGSLRATYPVATGGEYAWATYNMASLKSNEVYVEFWAKMPSAKQGLKFLKIFGGDSNGYANTTFALDYAGSDKGAMAQVSFGDGTGKGNDTGNVINFDGTNPDWIGRSYGTAAVRTPQNSAFPSSAWGTSWHHFRIHAKFNSGTTAANEIPDGEYYVEIDGKVYVDAKKLFNRNYVNAPIDRIELFGWSQSGSQPFEIWYDDVRISTGGFATSDPAPSPPDNVLVK